MATSYIPFNPSPTSTPPFAFKATLNGQPYSVTITWNLSGQRWFLNVLTLQGVLVWTGASVPSPLNYDINIVNGFFGTSSIVLRAASNQFEVTS
jgi:hypothetical protein